MSGKAISFARPPVQAEAWVQDKAQPAEPLKRFTVDVPETLHRRIKAQCAASGETMSDAVRRLLEQTFNQDGAA